MSDTFSINLSPAEITVISGAFMIAGWILKAQVNRLVEKIDEVEVVAWWGRGDHHDEVEFGGPELFDQAAEHIRARCDAGPRSLQFGDTLGQAVNPRADCIKFGHYINRITGRLSGDDREDMAVDGLQL